MVVPWVLSLSDPGWTAPACADLEVVRSRAEILERPRDDGTAERRAVVDIHLRSTSTSAVHRFVVGVFMGAGPRAIDATRIESLPTKRVRLLPEGGVALRRVFDEVIAPRSRRTLTLTTPVLPPDRLLAMVSARIVDCRRGPWAGRLQPPVTRSLSLPLAAAAGAVVLLGLVVLRLRRR